MGDGSWLFIYFPILWKYGAEKGYLVALGFDWFQERKIRMESSSQIQLRICAD
jgi:hypothetical protein